MIPNWKPLEKKLGPQRYRFKGKEELTLEQAQELMQRLQELDDLEKQLEQVRWNGTAQHVDSDKLREVLGDEAYQSVQSMKEIANALEEAGYIVKTSKGLELTPRAMRKIGQKALRDIFSVIKGRDDGMRTFDQALADLVRDNIITFDEGAAYCEDFFAYKRFVAGIMSTGDKGAIIA